MGIRAGVAVGGIWKGAGGVVGRIWKGARIWICVVLVGGLRVAVLYGVHVHVHGVGRAVEVDRVGFESFCNLSYKFGEFML